MAHKPGTYLGGIRTLEDLRMRCWVNEETDCWIARAGARPMKNVWLADLGESMRVARAAVILSGRKLKPYTWQTCGCKSCANPAHIRTGTPAEFGAYAKEAALYRNHPLKSSIGLANVMKARHVTANPELAQAIRESDLPSKDAARVFGVSRQVVIDVRSQRTWVPPVAKGASVFSWRPA